MWLVNTPSQHETLTQCWFNAVPPSATLAQPQTSTDSTPRVCWAAGLAVHTPANTKHWDSVGLLLGQCRWLWTSSKPTLAQCIMLVGIHTVGDEYKPTLIQCLLNVRPALRCWPHAWLQLRYSWGHFVTGDWTGSEIYSLKKEKIFSMITWYFWLNPQHARSLKTPSQLHASGAGQYPFSPSQYLSTSCWRDWVHIAYTAPMPFKCWPASCTIARHWTNARYTDTWPAIQTIPARCFAVLHQSWVNVGPPSVTLAHIQHGTKHNTVTQYWANVGSAS